MRFAMGAAAAILLAMATGGAAAEDGLGLSRERIAQWAGDHGASLAPVEVQEGRPETWQGMSADNATAVQVLGPADEVIEAAASLTILPGDEDLNMSQTRVAADFLALAAGWDRTPAWYWVLDCLGIGRQTNLRGGYTIQCVAHKEERWFEVRVWRE